jgi:hypothetical protein
VHRQVDLSGQQRVLDLFHEEPLAARLEERRPLPSIPCRRDDDDFRPAAGRLHPCGDCPRLPERERTAAGSEPQ